MTHTVERYRLLVLGTGQVGKTSIIRRYLQGTYSDRYKETVEDIFSRDFRIHGSLLPLDIYDTNYSYPDMRRVSIVSANAFMFVFSVDNVNSFKGATELVQEVLDRRSSELKTLPMMLIGNKSDIANKKIYPETVQAWLSHLSSKKCLPYMEVSAKDGYNIVSIFKSLLDQSGFPNHIIIDSTCPRSGRARPKPPPLPSQQSHEDPGAATSDSPKSPPAVSENRLSRITRTFSRKEKPVTAAGAVASNGNREIGGAGGLTRHGSLMRKTHRLSLKIKHAAPGEPDESDCRIS